MTIYTGGGINWTWYLDADIQPDGTIKVNREWRLHNWDERQGSNLHPKDVKSYYQVVENTLEESRTKGRIAIGIIIDGKSYYLTNGPISRWDLGK